MMSCLKKNANANEFTIQWMRTFPHPYFFVANVGTMADIKPNSNTSPRKIADPPGILG
jgi:uncharacterized protein (DUF2132 family)